MQIFHLTLQQVLPNTLFDLTNDYKTKRARPGFEPGTSRTLSENHTPRPTSHHATK